MNTLDKPFTRILMLLSIVMLLALPVAVSAYYNGDYFTGTYLRIGVNDYGALGIQDATVGSVGFQYPIGSGYESLAVGWWGDGWSVFYGANSAGFSPDDDPWGTLTGVTPLTSWTIWNNTVIHVTRMTTNDGVLGITIKTMFPLDSKFVVQEITIENLGADTITDLEFKKITDWDVWSSFTNYWGLDSIRHPELNLAVAFVNTTIASGTAYMGLAVMPDPTGVDLDWDDYYSRGLPSPTVYYIRADGTAEAAFDGAVVFDWYLGTLAPGQSRTLYTVFASGDTLDELENNTARAFAMVGPVVGGQLVQPGGGTGIHLAVASVAVFGIALLAIRRARRR